MNNIWQQLHKPTIALAPMAGITDMPFRVICSRFGADLVYSEMANATALVYQPLKTLTLLRSSSEEALRHSSVQAPVIMQLFGAEPEHFAFSASLLSNEKKCQELGAENYRKPVGLDINFGCPVSKVLKTGSGAKLFQDLDRAYEIIKITIANTDLPVSVKIRLSAGEVDYKKFLEKMADLPIASLMVHGRTLAQGFAGEVNYSAIKEARELFSGITLANGGINNVMQAEKMLAETGAHGLGLARGVLGKPWLFAQIKAGLAGEEFAVDKSLVAKTILEHAELVDKDNGYFLEFRKHLCWYATGLHNAKEIRNLAIKVNNLADVKQICELI